jgi:hypothetical protein
MTDDNGMDKLVIGRDRTILHLQQRIHLLEGLLTMAFQAMHDLPLSPLEQQKLTEIEQELSRVRTIDQRATNRD